MCSHDQSMQLGLPVQRKFSSCRKVQKSCNEHRDIVKNASLALYTINNDVMRMKV